MSKEISSTELVGQRFYDAVFNSLDVKASTIADYKYRMGHFHKFAMAHGTDRNLLLAYKRSLASCADYSVSTRNKYLTAATVFLKQCKELGFINEEISCHVSCFSQSKKHKKFGISEADAKRVCCWMKTNPQKYREVLMLSLLLFQGLRQAEVCSIQWNDVRLDERTIFVRGKGRDDKDPIHLHPATIKALQEYRLYSDECGGYVFSSKSRKGKGAKLTERGLRFIIKNILTELGIDKDVHGFRHFFTTHLIRTMPGELTRVAQFTRHRSLEMLTVYNDALLDEESHSLFDQAFDALRVM